MVMVDMRQSLTAKALVAVSGHSDDVVDINRTLWDVLTDAGARCPPLSKTGPSVGKQGCVYMAFTSGCRNVLTYGRLDTTLPKQEPLMLFSKLFLERHNIPLLEIENSVLGVSPCQFVELDEVILRAVDEVSYDVACSDERAIFSHLVNEKTILRQSSTYTMQIKNRTLTYGVMLSSPVLQGIASPATKFWVSKPFDSIESAKYLQSFDDVNNELDAACRLEFTFGDLNAETGLHFEVPEEDSFIDGNEGTVDATGHVLSQFGALSAESIATPVLVETPVPASWRSSRLDGIEDPESEVYVSFAVLAKFHLFSGSLISIAAKDTASRRACRIYGVDGLQNRNDLRVHVPPSLFFNLGLGSNVLLSIIPLPNEADSSLIPVAAEVTIARVAGRLTNDKRILDSAISQLREWFEDKERCACEGDVISVVVDGTVTDVLRHLVAVRVHRLTMPYLEEKAILQQMLAKQSPDELDANLDMSFLPSSDAAKGVAFFKITHAKVPATADGKLQSLIGSTFRVNPKKTAMLQTGIEHSRVPPHIQRYLGAASSPPAQSSGGDKTFTNLVALMSSCLHPASSAMGLSCKVLLHGPRGVGKLSLVTAVAEELGIHALEFNCFDLGGDTEARSEAFLQIYFEKAVATSPCVLILRQIDAFARQNVGAEQGDEPPIINVLAECFQMVNDSFAEMGHPVLIVATTSDLEKVPVNLQALFPHQVLLESPSEPARLHILSNLTAASPLAPDVSLPTLARQTAALVARDLVDLVGRAGMSAIDRALKTLEEVAATIPEADVVRAGVVITAHDFDEALDRVRTSHADSIGAPKIPNVTWDDVGGLSHVKESIFDTIQLPLEHPELFASGMKRRSGILLYGPPGTGKTLVAKAVATTFSLNFLSVKGPELLNMYIGESEANVRRVFQRARDARPCVVFFDELDSVAPKRGEKGDSGGVMDRIVSQLLAEIDGMGGGSDVFVIGATNRPDLLDPALLRPGRFDKLLYLGVSKTHDAQMNIVKALTRKFNLAPDFDHAAVAEKCPFNYTGADFYALCSDAMLKAMVRTIESVDAKIAALNSSGPHQSHPHPITPQYYLEVMATPEETNVQVTDQDFFAALAELVPSVSAQEMARYEEIRRRFEESDKKQTPKIPAAREELGGTEDTFPLPQRKADDVGSSSSSHTPASAVAVASPPVEPASQVSATSKASPPLDTNAEINGQKKKNRKKKDRKGKGKAPAVPGESDVDVAD
ncbi:peroxisomal assembly protein [Borealophlyctis nickersoniae]|nr:peroxisomal assembly protein [Borealophlyctis nickersoniae]